MPAKHSVPALTTDTSDRYFLLREEGIYVLHKPRAHQRQHHAKRVRRRWMGSSPPRAGNAHAKRVRRRGWALPTRPLLGNARHAWRTRDTVCKAYSCTLMPHPSHAFGLLPWRVSTVKPYLFSPLHRTARPWAVSVSKRLAAEGSLMRCSSTRFASRRSERTRSSPRYHARRPGRTQAMRGHLFARRLQSAPLPVLALVLLALSTELDRPWTARLNS